MPNVSPVKWHLAHTTWFFETFLLRPRMGGYRVYDASFEYLFNSYYNGISEQFPRHQRSLLSRPSLAEIYQYRAHVDDSVKHLLGEADNQIATILRLGLNHEQQHQELMLMDLKYNFSCNPLYPAFCDTPSIDSKTIAAVRGSVEVPSGIYEIGASPENTRFCFDNETPQHKIFLEGFKLDQYLVTNAEYLTFLEDGGYEPADLWLSDGWSWVQQQPAEKRAPLYWQQLDGRWFEFSLYGLNPLNLSQPLCHINYYEADAYARWSGCRLPTEQEWEVATALCAPAAPTIPSWGLHPSVSSGEDIVVNVAADQATDPAPVLHQLLNHLWQWTSSAYAAYPGFNPLSGVLGEYNGKFMVNQMVLRGGCCITPEGHTRSTYRNFYYPQERWQFSGIRLARNLT